MKTLAKIGLVAAAVAAVLFIFVYEIYGPSADNQNMAAAPEEKISDTNMLFKNPVEKEATVEVTPESEEANQEVPVEVSPEKEVPAPIVTKTIRDQVKIRRIYGKITLATTGENLAGVNVMIPGSKVAKISNNIGGYTIQVPEGTNELVFIYRGKKLVQRLNPDDNLLNVRLNLETMQYD